MDREVHEFLAGMDQVETASVEMLNALGRDEVHQLKDEMYTRLKPGNDHKTMVLAGLSLLGLGRALFLLADRKEQEQHHDRHKSDS